MRTKRSPDRHKIAQWRYDQIEEATDPSLTRRERARILKLKSKVPVCWPSGKTDPVSLAMLYRWCRAYRARKLEGLLPRVRSDRGKKRARLPGKVVTEGLRLLIDDPGMSLTFLIALLKAMFKGLSISRSTLQRRLSERDAYRRMRRAQMHNKRRCRFVSRHPHDIWHCDALGPVEIKLTTGEKLIFHVLTIIDDATRALLAAEIVLSANLGAAIRVFRKAAQRYGLCRRYYADRGRIFDAIAFRSGLATIGVHRIPTKAGNAQAHGKIEAYHRSLRGWFVSRLGRQQVVDLEHLQQLLEAFVEMYQTHRHRGIKTTPAAALAEQVSSRQVPPSRLYEIFAAKKDLKAHRVTGEVELHGITYLVPDELRGQRLTFLLDPPHEIEPVVVHPHSQAHLPLRRAMIKPQDLPDPAPPAPVRHAPGPLQTLYDNWKGMQRPQAEPGFGLPEIYGLLSKISGRHVPASDDEAITVQRFYQRHGPWSRAATEHAMRVIETQLGAGRPVRAYLDALAKRVANPDGSVERST